MARSRLFASGFDPWWSQSPHPWFVMIHGLVLCRRAANGATGFIQVQTGCKSHSLAKQICLPTISKCSCSSQSVKDRLDSFWLSATGFSPVLPSQPSQRSKALGSHRVPLSLYTCNELNSCSEINYLPCVVAASLNWIKAKWNGPMVGDDVMQQCTAGKRLLFLINIRLLIAVLDNGFSLCVPLEHQVHCDMAFAHVLFKLCHNTAAQTLSSVCMSLPHLQLQNMNVPLQKWLWFFFYSPENLFNLHLRAISLSATASVRLLGQGQCGFHIVRFPCARVRGSSLCKLESPLVAAVITTLTFPARRPRRWSASLCQRRLYSQPRRPRTKSSCTHCGTVWHDECGTDRGIDWWEPTCFFLFLPPLQSKADAVLPPANSSWLMVINWSTAFIVSFH